jgi:hypothetical protein
MNLRWQTSHGGTVYPRVEARNAERKEIDALTALGELLLLEEGVALRGT